MSDEPEVYDDTSTWHLLMAGTKRNEDGEPVGEHPERFVSPDGAVYRRKALRETKVDAIVRTPYGAIQLRRYDG